MKKVLFIPLITGMVLIFGACQSSQTATQPTVEEKLSEFGKEVERVYPDLASPGEISLLIELTGTDFVPGLIVDTANVPMYLGNADFGALALGMYTADLAYSSTFEQTPQTMATLVACQTLANDLGVGYTYLSALLDYYSEEVQNEDTLIKYLEDETGKIMEDLSGSDRQRLYTAFVTGFTLENLYLATAIIETYPEGLLPDDAKALALREMILVVLESERNINELIAMIEKVLTEEDPGILVDELAVMKASLDKVDFNEIARLENPAEILTNETLLEVTAEVKKIRSEILAGPVAE